MVCLSPQRWILILDDLAFARNYDPNCFLMLSKCSDLMDLGRGFKNYSEGVLRIGGDERISARILLIGADQDLLIPIAEQRRLAELLSAHGRQVHFRVRERREKRREEEKKRREQKRKRREKRKEERR